MNDLVSIIIPTYNRAHLIAETLDSILAQTYKTWECIIIDDGSNDDTAAIAQAYVQSDSRFQYYERPKDRLKGPNSCRNFGFEVSNGEFIKWFDSDDIMHPQFLEKQINVLVDDNSLDFCASFSVNFSESIINVIGNYNPEIFTDDENSLSYYIRGKLIFLTPSPLWRRPFLNNKNLFDETLFYAHETDFNFARLCEGASFKYLTDILFYVRRAHASLDKNFKNNYKAHLSVFKYYQKVIAYLKSPSCFFTIKEKNMLLKVVLKKQLLILYFLSQNKPVVYSIKEFKLMLQNINTVNLKLTAWTKINIGMFLLFFFKRGYRYLNFKT